MFLYFCKLKDCLLYVTCWYPKCPLMHGQKYRGPRLQALDEGECMVVHGYAVKFRSIKKANTTYNRTFFNNHVDSSYHD